MEFDRIKNYIKQAPVNSVLLAIMIIYFVLMTLNGGTTNIGTLLRFGAMFGPLVKEYNQYYRLITSIFIHIGFMHIFFNGYALYIFGTQIEKVMGHMKYILFFLLTGLGGNLLTYAFNYEVVSAGASGSLFGMFGAFVYLIRHHPNMVTPQGRRSIIQLLVINIGLTLIVPNISATAHFGGLIAGYLLSYAFID